MNVNSTLLSVAVFTLSAIAFRPLAWAQAPSNVYAACVGKAVDDGSRQLCRSQRDEAARALRLSIAKAGIDLQPDARMVDEFQRSGQWDLMRALQLSHGKRIRVAPAASKPE